MRIQQMMRVWVVQCCVGLIAFCGPLFDAVAQDKPDNSTENSNNEPTTQEENTDQENTNDVTAEQESGRGRGALRHPRLFTGNFYTIIPPENWVVVEGADPNTHVDGHKDLMRFNLYRTQDVLFMDGQDFEIRTRRGGSNTGTNTGSTAPTTDLKRDFRDCLSIVTQVKNDSEETFKKIDSTVLLNTLTQQYKNTFTEATVELGTTTKLNEYDAIEVKTEYKLKFDEETRGTLVTQEFHVKMIQYLVDLPKVTLTLTCAYAASREETMSKLCLDAMGTLKHTARTIR
jgi:hypothetical protein